MVWQRKKEEESKAQCRVQSQFLAKTHGKKPSHFSNSFNHSFLLQSRINLHINVFGLLILKNLQKLKTTFVICQTHSVTCFRITCSKKSFKNSKLLSLFPKLIQSLVLTSITRSYLSHVIWPFSLFQIKINQNFKEIWST